MTPSPHTEALRRFDERFDHRGYMLSENQLAGARDFLLTELEAAYKAGREVGNKEGRREGIGNFRKATIKRLGELLFQAGGVADPKMVKFIRLFITNWKESNSSRPTP